MSRILRDLDLRFYPTACELIAKCVEAGIPVMIITTGRTADEQADCVKRGVSWTKRSKHQDGLAIDICPWEEFRLHGPDKLAWDADSPVWDTIGKIGESLGLKWGVIKNGARIDLGHFEYVTAFMPNPPDLMGEA